MFGLTLPKSRAGFDRGRQHDVGGGSDSVIMGHVQRRADRPGWVARYTDPAGRERSRSFRRKVDAERFLLTTEGSKLRGEWIDPALARMTVAAFSERWRATIQQLPASTRAGYETKLRVHVLPNFGDLPLGAVTGLAVREWVVGIQAKGLSRHTARQAKHVLSAIFKLAIEEGFVAKNPVATIRIGRSSREEQRFLSDGEVAALADAIDPRYKAWVWFMAYSGLRWGEAAALRRDRVDGRRVRVVQSLSEVGGAHVKETKTYGSRTVILPAYVAELLAEHLANSRVTQGDFVFASARGGLLHSRNFRRRIWEPALVRAGLAPEFRIHDLRHTCAALMISEGANPKQIQSHLGHSSINVTMDNYGHLFSGDVEALADRMDERIRRVHRTTRSDHEIAGRDVDGTRAPG